MNQYEIRIYSESCKISAFFPISGTFENCRRFADIVGQRHARYLAPGDTLAVSLIQLDADGIERAKWHARFIDPATARILEINQANQHASESDHQGSAGS